MGRDIQFVAVTHALHRFSDRLRVAENCLQLAD